MKVCAVCEPGRMPFSHRILIENGFDIQSFPVVKDLSGIEIGKFTIDPRLYEFTNRTPECNEFENSLRASFTNMLEKNTDDEECTCIYGESDITPSYFVTPDWLGDNLFSLPEFDLYDAVLLFNNCFAYPAVLDGEPIDGSCIIDVKKLVSTYEHNRSSRPAEIALWGTHAIYIKPEVKATVINSLKTVIGPLDCVFMHLGLAGVLKVGKLTTNLFYQIPHSYNHTEIK